MEKSIPVIAVIDASRLARAGLVSLLRQSGYCLIYEGDTLATLDAKEGDSNKIETVIVRLTHERADPKEIMENSRNLAPNARVVFLVPQLNVNSLSECFSAGASGYLSESTSQETLMGSLRLVSAGGKAFPAELAELIPSVTSARRHKQMLSTDGFDRSTQSNTLSERELDVLRELGDGLPNKMIANRLGIAEATVKVYVKRVLRKIGVHNRTQAALWAATHGLGGRSGEWPP